MKYETEAGVLKIFAEEDLISTSIDPIIKEWEKLFDETKELEQVILDIEKVKVIDSQGLNLVIALYKECRKIDCSFSIVNCSPTNRRLFAVLNLTKPFDVRAADPA